MQNRNGSLIPFARSCSHSETTTAWPSPRPRKEGGEKGAASFSGAGYTASERPILLCQDAILTAGRDFATR
jgi:hypothetical protein